MIKTISQAKLRPAKQYIYDLQPWKVQHFPDRSEITAYVEASGSWETLLIIKPTSGCSPEKAAEYIGAVMNEHQKERKLLEDAVNALEAILHDGMSFSSEQVADQVIGKIRREL